ncbi:hypothetical protein N7454_004224 [Penicillium verhagenii]|nr:hypothetical protein N7454_004224 [Penicillium verhagenii]
MFVLVPHKYRGRGILSLLRSYLRKSHFRKHRQECECKETPAQSPNPPTHPTKKAHPETNDTNSIVQQLAALADTVSRVSTIDADTSIDSNGWTEKDQEGESFHYLRSLITISYLAPNPPEPTPPNQSLPRLATPPSQASLLTPQFPSRHPHSISLLRPQGRPQAEGLAALHYHPTRLRRKANLHSPGGPLLVRRRSAE